MRISMATNPLPVSVPMLRLSCFVTVVAGGKRLRPGRSNDVACILSRKPPRLALSSFESPSRLPVLISRHDKLEITSGSPVAVHVVEGSHMASTVE